MRLIEIPSRLEADDNIAAFWIPAGQILAGDEREFSYRLTWGDLVPDANDALAHVAETRTGQGGVSGVENATTLRKFVIDFAGGDLAAMAPDSKFDIAATVSAGTITSTSFSRIDANGMWRLVLDVETIGQPVIELKAAVSTGGRPLTKPGSISGAENRHEARRIPVPWRTSGRPAEHAQTGPGTRPQPPRPAAVRVPGLAASLTPPMTVVSPSNGQAGRVTTLRLLMLTFAAAASLAAGWAFLHLVGGNRPSALDWVRTVLLVIATFWLVFGA